MDRSFSSSLFNPRSPFSPRSRQNISSKRSTVPLRKTSRMSVSGRSTQSIQIILKSQSNCVERFGQPLPVLITEALTFADRNTVVSARISSECGFAWLVCGRRLLIWQYRQSPAQLASGTPKRGTITNQCYELQLPQSDLAHRAELISVFLSKGTNIPSCIAVSPEGVVRYWPTIAHEGVSIEQHIDLQGQECDSLTGIEGLGCILATTTCTIVLVQTLTQAGRPILNCKTLKMPSGWLGGLSKRMSSLIFGPNNSEQSAETRLVRVLAVPFKDGIWNVYVLAGHSLQKWKLSNYEPEQLIYVADLSRLVRDGFFGTVWEHVVGEQSETDTWILDLQSDNGNVTLLAAAVNMHLSPQIHYALISLETNAPTAPSQFINFLVLKLSGLYREDDPSECLGYRFLLSSNTAYIYNNRNITVVKPHEEPDCLEFNSPQDFLLGGSICVNTPVFFSRNHGLVAISNNDMASDLNMSSVSASVALETSFNDAGLDNLSLYNFNPEELYAAYKDTVGQFKAAFVFYIKNQHAACTDILNELFISDPLPGVDTTLDKVVASVSQDLLDDIPANDPRWLEEAEDRWQVGLGSSYAMQVQQQLEDKQKAHSAFVKFLIDTDLWRKLSTVTVRNTPFATVSVLGENSEKIVAAIALKSAILHGDLIQKAIERTVSNTDINPKSGLTHQDLFYREVSKIYRVINELVNECEEAVHSDLNPVEVAQLLNDTNIVILDVLKEITQYRLSNVFSPSLVALEYAPDYLPWTSASGEEGLMDALLTQQNLTYNYGAKVTSDYTLKTFLYQQLVSLIDFILDGRKLHLESIRNTPQENVLTKQYQVVRKRLIEPLIRESQWEGAALLAEKYLEFESLVMICEKTNNQARLDEYIQRFSNEDFDQFVYTWYLQQNKQGKLIDRCRKPGASKKDLNQLRKFLSQHPSLSWIQNAFDRKYDDAAETLMSLASIETEFVTRQKTMLSLAKLAILADGKKIDDDVIENIDNKLEVIGYQEAIPDYVLQEFGFDVLKPAVIAPKDLIHLYICPEYKDATEIEFKKALDLLAFIDDDELRNELTLRIWRNAILRDEWDEKNLDAPIDILQTKLMFKIADLAIVLGADAQNLLPPIDALLEDAELIQFQDNKAFQYLIKAGYEHVAKVMQI